MAHLVNAKSFRLGWNSLWCDLWYAYEYNYASFLFISFRIRAFLKKIFFDIKIDKTKFYIFSHFVMFKAFRYITIEIYFYFIPHSRIMNSIFSHRIPAFYKWAVSRFESTNVRSLLSKQARYFRKKYKKKMRFWNI